MNVEQCKCAVAFMLNMLLVLRAKVIIRNSLCAHRPVQLYKEHLDVRDRPWPS